MSYTKQTWQSGDTITATKLNHMEDGIAAGGDSLFVLSETTTIDGQTITHTLNATYNEMAQAAQAGKLIGFIHIPTVGEVGIHYAPLVEVIYESPYQAAAESGLEPGYYLKDPWGSNNSFYSETADGVMMYVDDGK